MGMALLNSTTHEMQTMPFMKCTIAHFVAIESPSSMPRAHRDQLLKESVGLEDVEKAIVIADDVATTIITVGHLVIGVIVVGLVAARVQKVDHLGVSVTRHPTANTDPDLQAVLESETIAEAVVQDEAEVAAVAVVEVTAEVQAAVEMAIQGITHDETKAQVHHLDRWKRNSSL